VKLMTRARENIRGLANSFRSASEGIVYAINSQRNMKIHLLGALAILASGLCLHFTATEVLVVAICIALVFGSEIINTAIENAVDMAMKDYDEYAKQAKDSAAGAVFIIVLIVVFVGAIIVVPYLMILFFGDWQRAPTDPLAFHSIQGLALIFFTYGVKAAWYNFGKKYQPHILVGISFYILALISVLVPEYNLYLLGVLVFGILYFLYRRVYWLAILQNLIISIGGFYLSYFVFY